MVNNLDVVYAALADPTRRSMISRLQAGGLTVSELAEPYAMSLAAVGKHVAVLETANIVQTTKRGRVRSCELVPDALSPAEEWISRHSRFWTAGLDSLATHLEEKP